MTTTRTSQFKTETLVLSSGTVVETVNLLTEGLSAASELYGPTSGGAWGHLRVHPAPETRVGAHRLERGPADADMIVVDIGKSGNLFLTLGQALDLVSGVIAALGPIVTEAQTPGD